MSSNFLTRRDMLLRTAHDFGMKALAGLTTRAATTYCYSGRDFRLTDVHGNVVKETMA